MNTVSNKYQIIFRKKVDKNPFTGLTQVEAIIDTLNKKNFILVRFFSDYYRERDIQEYILDVIKSVLENNIDEGRTGSQSGVDAWISPSSTKFVNFNGSSSYLEPDLIIPTEDFKQIASEWKKFIAAE